MAAVGLASGLEEADSFVLLPMTAAGLASGLPSEPEPEPGSIDFKTFAYRLFVT
jgi:hypothetical protein